MEQRKRRWTLAWILTPSITFAVGMFYGVNESHSRGHGIDTTDILSGFEYGFYFSGVSSAILGIVYAVSKGAEKSRRNREWSKNNDDAPEMGEEATPSDITPLVEKETTPSYITIKCPVCNNPHNFSIWEKSGDTQCPHGNCKTPLHYDAEARTLRLQKDR